LTIDNLSVDDQGVYECVAASVVSSVITTTLLIIELSSQHPPMNVSAETTRTTAKVSWLPAYDAGSPLHYVIWYRTPHVTKADWRTLRAFPVAAEVTSITLHQLRPDTLYELMVMARNRLGDPLYSDVISTRTKPAGSTNVPTDPYYSAMPDVPRFINTPSLASPSYGQASQRSRPPQPFNLTIRQHRNTLQITWSVPDQSASSAPRPADYYVIQYRTVGQWVPLTDRIDGSTTAYNWTTASRGATYNFRVISYYDRPTPALPPEASMEEKEEVEVVLEGEKEFENISNEELESLPSAVVIIKTGDPMVDGLRTSNSALSGVGLYALSAVAGLVVVVIAVQLYRRWQRLKKARQLTGHNVLPTTDSEPDAQQYDNHMETQLDNGKVTKIKETPI
jgi:hypothetical protein